MAGRDPLLGGTVCARARAWASLRLDDELSVLEEELLERHLGACEACRLVEAGMRSTATALRAAPFEQPSRRVAVPAARRAPLSIGRRRTAVVAAAALVLGSVVGSLLERPSQPTPATPGQVSLLSRDVNLQLDLPRRPPTRPAPVPSTPPNPPEGVI